MERKVALDIHRRSLFVLIMEGGKQVLRRRFAPDPEGLAALLALLQPGDRVVMEATTHAFRLAARLESVGATVLVLDPQQTRAVGMKGKKTDYRDCLALLRYLDDPHPPAVWCPDRRTREIRQLTRERFAFNQSLVRLKNRVRGLLADEGLEPPHAPWEPEGRAWLEAQTLAPVTRRILERELAECEPRSSRGVAIPWCAEVHRLGRSLEAIRLGHLPGRSRWAGPEECRPYTWPSHQCLDRNRGR